MIHATLSDAELLALLLDSDAPVTAEYLLNRLGGLHGLARATAADLQELKRVEVVRVLAAVELSKRLLIYNPADRPLLSSAADAARLMADMQFLDQEHVRVILLDLTRHVTAVHTVYIGTLNASVLRVAEIFREAIIRSSPAVVIVHNHPAGDPSPSPEDVELTRSLAAAGRLLDISLIDHLIIGHGSFASLKEMGIAF